MDIQTAPVQRFLFTSLPSYNSMIFVSWNRLTKTETEWHPIAHYQTVLVKALASILQLPGPGILNKSPHGFCKPWQHLCANEEISLPLGKKQTASTELGKRKPTWTPPHPHRPSARTLRHNQNHSQGPHLCFNLSVSCRTDRHSEVSNLLKA